MIAKVTEVIPIGLFHAVAQPGMVVEVVVCEPDVPHIQIIVSLHTAFADAGLKADACTVMGMIVAFANDTERDNAKIA